MVSDTISRGLPPFFSPFPHGTRSLSVLFVFSLGVWSPQIQKRVCRLLTYSGTSYGSFCFRIRGFHGLWPIIPHCSTNNHCPMLESYNPRKIWFGLIPFRSSLTKEISFVFFSCAYLDISVQHVPPQTINCLGHLVNKAGLPHSDTAGSQLFGSYPTTFAPYASFFGQTSQGIHLLL